MHSKKHQHNRRYKVNIEIVRLKGINANLKALYNGDMASIRILLEKLRLLNMNIGYTLFFIPNPLKNVKDIKKSFGPIKVEAK